MAKQSLALAVAQVASGNPILEIISSATNLTEIGEITISMNAPAGGRLGIGFPAAIGITPTTPTTLQLHDARDQAAQASIATAWGTAPTVPAQFLYRFNLPASVGSLIDITIPEGIIIPKAQTLVLWSITTVDAADYTIIANTTPKGQIRYIT